MEKTNQHQSRTLSIKLELLWWLITAIIVFAVLYPILSNISDYPFTVPNIVAITIFISFARYIFLLKYTFLAKRQYLKIGLIFICLPLFFYLINQLNFFQTYLDEKGIYAMLKEVPYEKQTPLESFIRNEMIFFSVASIITTAMMPFRMIISVWRTHNKGTS